MAGRRVQNREERRGQILAAARSEFASRGYHATQISHIVERAGIARGTFYYHYEGKRQVFAALLDSILSIVDGNLGQIDPDRPVRVQVVRNIAAMVRILVEHVDLAHILLEQAVALDEGSNEQLRRFYDRLLSRIEGTIREGQRIGFLRSGDPAVISICLIGTVKEVIYQYMLGTRRPPVSTLVREVVGYALDGIVVAGDPSPLY